MEKEKQNRNYKRKEKENKKTMAGLFLPGRPIKLLPYIAKSKDQRRQVGPGWQSQRARPRVMPLTGGLVRQDSSPRAVVADDDILDPYASPACIARVATH